MCVHSGAPLPLLCREALHFGAVAGAAVLFGEDGEERKMELKIEYLNVDQLTPYENNTRRHAPEDIEQIRKSIEQNGFNDPIGIWGKENIIVEGHGRLLAAQEMGLEKVPCIRLDHLTDTQRRDYAIWHNRTAELSGWDFGKLEEEIARLEIEGVDLSGLKFDINVLNGGGNPIPDNLDADEDYNSSAPIAVKLTFHNYVGYAQHEQELKDFADEIGAEFSVVKA